MNPAWVQLYLVRIVLDHQGINFLTVGRANREGVVFTFTQRKNKFRKDKNLECYREQIYKPPLQFSSLCGTYEVCELFVEAFHTT